MKLKKTILLLAAFITFTAHAQTATQVAEYEKALNQIHEFSGSGDAIEQAMKTAEGFLKTLPKSGFGETLFAEYLSSWRLDQQGQPVEFREKIVELADVAIKHNPKMAQAHTAKARVYVRSGNFVLADQAIDAALVIDKKLAGAIFLRADIFRKTNKLAEAESWYLKFIDATNSKGRKANGYAWIGSMYQFVGQVEGPEQKNHLHKARTAYEKMLELDGTGPWRLVNFAIFLNDQIADFKAAEKYAVKALEIMEFSMARHHFAAAKYQQLWQNMGQFNKQQLNAKIDVIELEVRVSLVDLQAFSGLSYQVIERLAALNKARN